MPESPTPVNTQPLTPTPPAWVRGYITSENPSLFTLLSAHIPGALVLSADELGEAVTGIYRAILRDVRSRQQHPVRVWNFVPSIHSQLGAGDRYMAFNAGRFAAFSESLGAEPASIPTASAVGIDRETLWVHVLAADEPGRPVENPRQAPAYRYSRRYGVRPPCFARATRLESTLFIGGTASITGEDSRHIADIAAQTQETLSNLRSLIATALDIPESCALKTLRDARVHVTNASYAPIVRDALEPLLLADTNLEFVQADLCRKELLVEIEGIATWS
jgi:chorismate lyase / 3-hydroxybenzoate synthase